MTPNCCSVPSIASDTLNALITTFKATPTFFFTENDLVCWLATSLNAALGEDGFARDRDGHRHMLVHTEYPTPFRCKMEHGGFEPKRLRTAGMKGGDISVATLTWSC